VKRTTSTTSIMSGHSHFATIKRQKESKDAAKGKIFSRHAKALAIAIKAGGSPNPDMNSRLRFAIDQAKADNMPKSNIDRVLARAEEAGNIDEIMYEGFGPAGTMVLVETATDNRNRTAQEMKSLFEKNGGNMGGPGSVSFNFDPHGLIVITKEGNPEEQMLALIDAGAEDIVEADDSLEVYMTPDKLGEMKKALESANFKISSFELTHRPKNYQVIDDVATAEKVLAFLDNLENHEDVQRVHANVDIPEEILKQVSN
jgi:YebC/PmpR family DNA-binding regulatory protein